MSNEALSQFCHSLQRSVWFFDLNVLRKYCPDPLLVLDSSEDINEFYQPQVCHGVSECNVYWFVQFAEAACGVVQVMLNGSIEAGAFRSTRYHSTRNLSCFCGAACGCLPGSPSAEVILINLPLAVVQLILFTPFVQRL